MRGFDHETIVSPSFHGVRKERLAQWPSICDPNTTKKVRGYFRKNWVGMCGTLPETLTLLQSKICDFSYLPYSRPDQRFDTLFQTWSPGAQGVTGARDKLYTVVGVNIKRETILSPNDEEVVYSLKKHIQFKTRVHKP